MWFTAAIAVGNGATSPVRLVAGLFERRSGAPLEGPTLAHPEALAPLPDLAGAQRLVLAAGPVLVAELGRLHSAADELLVVGHPAVGEQAPACLGGIRPHVLVAHLEQGLAQKRAGHLPPAHRVGPQSRDLPHRGMR